MQSTTSVIADPLESITEEFLQDPYPIYKLLREQSPVLWNESRRWWVISRYEDVRTILLDRRFTKRYTSKLQRLLNKVEPLSNLFRFGWDTIVESGPKPCKWLAGKDDPDHTRLRSAANPIFSPSRIRTLEPFIRHVCEQHIDEFQNRSGCDLMKDYANDVPFKVIGEIIGIPVENQSQVRLWCQDIALTFEINPGEDRYRVAMKAMEHFVEYLKPLLFSRNRQPANDLISEFARSSSGLSQDEALSNLVLLTLSGYETTIPLIGNGLYALLREPGQLQLLRDEPDLISSAVEEILRYDPPIQLAHYVVNETLEHGGQVLSAGDQVYALIGSANRDPEVFESPDVFDITRQDRNHLSFGAGIHYCIGANLARLEGQIAINTLLARIPVIGLTGSEIKYKSVRPRVLESLPVSF